MTKPFAGVRVVEVAAWTFVPAAGAILADFGADVVKVEPPSGDPQRGLRSRLQSLDGQAANPFLEIPNRGKRSITLDLGTEAGRGVLLDLVRSADVFLTSYLEPVRRKLGIDVDDLRAVNDRLVYVRGTGWGPRGPMADTGGFDLAAAWAVSSMANRMTRAGDEPMYQPSAFFDLLGANTLAGAIGTALFQRERTGEAREVDVSLMSVGMWALSPDLMSAPTAPTDESRNRTKVPNPLVNSYGTADDRWLYLVCLQADRFWVELCETIGRSDLAADERFVDMRTRETHAAACISELDATFATRTLDEWRAALASFSGVWAPVLRPIELYGHPQVDANGYLPPCTSGDGVSYRLPAPPMQFGEPGAPSAPAPELGQHTEELLLELGLSWGEIVELRLSGALD